MELSFAIAVAVSLAVAHAQGAELKVFVGGAMTETVTKIGNEFAKSSGHKLEFVSDTTGALINKLKAGEKADVDRGDGNRDRRITEGRRAGSRKRAPISCVRWSASP